ncbi:UPAR/Ly6 domain-containing protein cold-like [Mytilus edulis]|uniref:UPAR/Ly6 domain-containing protein cold-like n=1 Tax=Mytilus edulis TaxID=6550 RepID=UPI0039EF367D
MANLYVLIVFLALPAFSIALECYVCEAQNSNKDKCVKTTIQCRQEEDTCRTQIKWQQPLFWQPRSERYHYISKTCDTSTHCQQESVGLGVRCMKDWYRDWTCVECCQGDRCNYYTTLGAGTTQISLILLVSMIVVQFFIRHR